MKTCILLSIILFFAQSNRPVPKNLTNSTWISFRSETPVRVIQSDNHRAVFRFDNISGEIICEVPVKSFEFDFPMMKTNFNNYFMESEKFPCAYFRGRIVDLRAVNFEKDGDYPIQVNGELTIRGIAQQVSASGRIEVKKQLPTLYGTLEIALADYGVPYPEFVREKVSDKVLLTIAARCGENIR